MSFNIMSSFLNPISFLSSIIPVDLTAFVSFSSSFNTAYASVAGLNNALSVATQNSSIAISNDGQTIIVGTNVSSIVISRNGGTSWTNYTYTGGNSQPSSGVAMSADGTYIYQLAGSITSNYFRRSSDNGVNWTYSSPSGTVSVNNFRGVTCSSTGQFVCLCGVNLSFFAFSNNYGASFTNISGALTSPISAYISDDGKYIVSMNTSSTGLYKCINAINADGSINSSSTFSTTGIGSVINNKLSICLSSNKQYWLVTTNNSTSVYISNDSGATFTQPVIDSANTLLKSFGCMSPDGSKMIVQFNGGLCYYSTNYGVSWSKVNTPLINTNTNWVGCCINRNGTWAGIINTTTGTNRLFIADNVP